MNDTQSETIKNKLKVFTDKFRPVDEDGAVVHINYSWDGKIAVLYKVHPAVDNATGDKMVEFAKIRCYPDCGIWNLYRKTASGGWKAYPSQWYSKSLEKALDEIAKDDHRCLWHAPSVSNTVSSVAR